MHAEAAAGGAGGRAGRAHQHPLLVRLHAVGALERLALHLLPHHVLRGAQVWGRKYEGVRGS